MAGAFFSSPGSLKIALSLAGAWVRFLAIVLAFGSENIVVYNSEQGEQKDENPDASQASAAVKTPVLIVLVRFRH